MKILIFASAIFALALSVSCQKKDEGGGNSAPPGCPAGHSLSSAWGRCLPQAECPVGLAQSPTEASMCIDLRTGQNVMQQQCGAGYFLTAHGCYQQGPCNPGQALRGDVCVQVVSGSSSGGANGSYFQNQNPSYGSPYGNSGYGSPYGQPNSYPNYYRGF